MKFSISLMNFDYLDDANLIADLAKEAEEAGWDAVFLADHVNWKDKGVHVDPWIALGLIADRTDKMQIGTAVTPIARRRPTKLAREILTLHRLSGGRFILGAGSGIWPSEYGDLGDEPDLRIRAEMLDEGLTLLQELWGGDDVDHHGKHYQAKSQTFCPGGADIPIWIGASWPSKRPFRRAARFDGVMAINRDFRNPLTPTDVRGIKEFITTHRDSNRPYNIGIAMTASADEKTDIERARAFESAGADWWQEGIFPFAETFGDLRTIIRRGPPKT